MPIKLEYIKLPAPKPKISTEDTKLYLSFHLKFKHEEEAFQCVECKDKTKFFLNELELLMHNAKFHPIYVEDNYNKEAMQCEKCLKPYGSLYQLCEHLKKFHFKKVFQYRTSYL